MAGAACGLTEASGESVQAELESTPVWPYHTQGEERIDDDILRGVGDGGVVDAVCIVIRPPHPHRAV